MREVDSRRLDPLTPVVVKTAVGEEQVDYLYEHQAAFPGVRIVQIAYMTGNLLADGCLEPRDAGLTLFGRAVVRELNRHGMLVDGHRIQRTAVHDGSRVKIGATTITVRVTEEPLSEEWGDV